MNDKNKARTLHALPVKDRISQITEEIRIVLPGSGVLLGFQFIVPFSNTFNALGQTLQNIYIFSLICIVVTVLLLIAPVAYDRMTSDHTDLMSLYSFANIMIRVSLFTLALGISMDVYIIVSMITKSTTFSGSVAGGIFILCLSLWFGYSLTKK